MGKGSIDPGLMEFPEAYPHLRSAVGETRVFHFSLTFRIKQDRRRVSVD